MLNRLFLLQLVLPLFLLFQIKENCIAQDLNKLKKDEWLRINGGVNARYELLDFGMLSSDRKGFNQVYSGNIDIQLLGLSFPLSFQYSDRKWNNSPLPFNRSSLHPRYKNWSSSFGTFSPQYSSYSLSGKLIKGGEIAFHSTKWSGKLTGGKDLFTTSVFTVEPNTNKFLGGFSQQIHLKKIQWDQSLVVSILNQNSAYLFGDMVISNGAVYQPSNNFELQLKSDLSLPQRSAYFGSGYYPQQHLFFSWTSRMKNWKIGIETEHTDRNYSSPGVLFLQRDMQRLSLTNEWRIPAKGFQARIQTGLISYGLHKPVANRRNQLDLRYSISAQIKKSTTISSQGMNNVSYSVGQLQPGINLQEDTLKWIRSSSNYSAQLSHLFKKKSGIKNILINTQGARSSELSSSIDNSKEEIQRDPFRWSTRVSGTFQFAQQKIQSNLQISAIGVEEKINRYIVGINNTWNSQKGWSISGALHYQIDAFNSSESYQEVFSISYRPKKLKDFNFLLNTAFSQQGRNRSYRSLLSLNYHFGK